MVSLASALMEATLETPAALLLRRWAEAAAAGALRSGVEETQRRWLPGDLGVVAQFSASHRQLKRPVDAALLAPKAATALAFDFTRAKPIEFLAGIAFGADRVEVFELEGDSVGGFRAQAASVALLNVSPLVHGHSLVLLDWALVKPQRLERDLLGRGVAFARAVNRDNFALGFNSAGAWSSVNHFHFQGVFFAPPDGSSWINFPVTRQPRVDMFRVGASAVAQRLPQWPMACYAIGLHRGGRNETAKATRDVAVADVVEVAWALVHVLQQREIPHNVLMTGVPEVVVWVFPRQPQQENGVNLFGGDAGRLRFAIAEVAGLVVAGDDEVYQGMDEAAFAQILRDEVSIAPDLASDVEREWMETVGERTSTIFDAKG